MSAMAKLWLWLLPFQLLAEQCDDEQVFMQRSPVKVLAAPGGFSNQGANDGNLPTDITALPRWDAVSMAMPWASVAVYSILLMFLMKYQDRVEEMSAKMDVEAFREDVQVFSAAWKKSSNLRKALLYFSYCQHIGSNIYGLTLALLAVLGNVGFALLFLEPWVPRPFWEESLHLLLGAIALLMATMVEATMRSRYALEANRAANVVFGFLGAKSRRLQECKEVTAVELVQWKEDLKEVLYGLFQLAVVPLQVAPVFLWLWMKLGYLTFLLLGAAVPLALADRKSRAAVPAFLAYEEASRQRWDLLATGSGKHSEVELHEEIQQLRRKALDALRVIHYQSQSLAFCISRWPQLLVLALLLCASRWLLLTPEVLLVVFLQCHYVLRHLSLLITVMTSSKWTSCQKLEAVLQQEEVPPVAEVNTADHLLEMKGCFSWQTDDSPLPSLAKVDLKVTRGEVVAILGTAGAGKSSFLRAACGCLTPLNGAELRRTHSCMFLPAEPWIFQGTLQQNILCSRALDLERYHKVLKACGLDADLEDVHQLPRLWHQRIALARAFYGTEALLLMDDPFAGFSHEDVDRLSEIFHSDLFTQRSCILSFGTSASQRMLRNKTDLPGLRLILLEAGTMQVVQELPEFLNNEAFCCQRSSTFLRTTPKDVPAEICDETPMSMVEFVSRVAKCNAFTWLSVLFLDQFLQIALDWWVLSTVLTSMPTSLMPMLMLLGAHVSFKLLLAYFTSWMDFLIPFTPLERNQEREMDLFWPGQIWGLVAGLCSIFAWLALSYLQLTASLGRSFSTFSLVLVYVIAIKALPSSAASPMKCEASLPSPSLQLSLELGMATTLLTGEERYFETREEEILALAQHDHRSRSFLLPLGLCLSAAYTITALLLSVNTIHSKEAILTLAPFGVLLQFLIPWTGSLKECQVLGQHWRAKRSKGNASEHLLKSERIQ